MLTLHGRAFALFLFSWTCCGRDVVAAAPETGLEMIDLEHRCYQNQMQINGSKNDRFVVYGNSCALPMHHCDGSRPPLWAIAKRYTLADNFFMGAFGGSFLDHFYLNCDDFGSNRSEVIVIDSKSSERAAGGDKAFADPSFAGTLPPRADVTIGDLLSAKGIAWAWYAGAWPAALDHVSLERDPRFQSHHQPFNFFANFAPGSVARKEHLRDGGLDGLAFLEAIDAGTLPRVSFYKPQASLTEHAGHADILSGNRHAAEIVAHLEKSPQWPHMLVVTHDENGGFWDHAAPPKGDRWGPGTRSPALIVSPYAKQGFVDHTLSDTGSIPRFIAERFDLPELPGIALRDASMAAAAGRKPGDLMKALDIAGAGP